MTPEKYKYGQQPPPKRFPRSECRDPLTFRMKKIIIGSCTTPALYHRQRRTLRSSTASCSRRCPPRPRDALARVANTF
ncbi:hypothetical protein K523DRAFT_357781 [Schizophyllum commune Tattone D]|nr:hypothetical protein K523DRAFT_357781 [Schizophyllum commune Tattone D]